MIYIAYCIGKRGWLRSSEGYPTFVQAKRAMDDQVRREMIAGLTPLPRRAEGREVEAIAA